MKNNNKTISRSFLYIIFACYAAEGVIETLVGSVWPSIAKDINVHLSLIGILTMITYISSIFSCIITNKIRTKLGTNYTTILSVSFFAIAAFLYSISNNFILYAIGAAIVGLSIIILDINSDSYILKAYGAKESSILHSFYGVGGFIAPLILSFTISHFSSYKIGYTFFLFVFLMLIALLLLAKRNWENKKLYLDKDLVDKHSITADEKSTDTSYKNLFKTKNVIPLTLLFFLEKSIVRTFNPMVATVLVNQKGVSNLLATQVAGIFFIALFVGRVFWGLISDKFSSKAILYTSFIIQTVIFLLLFSNIFNDIVTIGLIVVLGFVEASLVPFVGAFAKEHLNINILSAFLGLGSLVGLIGASITSALSAFVIQNFSISIMELVYAIISILSCIIIFKVSKENS